MNILIVDDDERIRTLLRRMLTMAGHRVLAAADGVEALGVLQREPVDVIITDLMMPRMDGYRLCQAVRGDDRLKEVPLIFHTTHTSPADEKLAFELGADLFLHKPASVDTVLETLRRVSSQPRAARPHSAVTMPESALMQEYSDRLVTKLEQRNVELAAAEARFRTLVEQSLVGIYVIQDEQFTYVNPRMAETLGQPAGEMTSRPIYDFIVPEDHAQVRENLRKRISGEAESIHYTLRMRHNGGRVIDVEAHGGRAEYNGRPAVMGTLIDVTERKRAEEALRASEQRLRTIIQTEPECVKLVSPEGRALEMNPAGLAMLEADSLAEVCSRSLLDFVAPEHRAAFSQLHQQVMQGEKSALEFEVIGLQGTRRWLDTRAVPMRDSSGTVTALLGITRDITERRRSETALRQSEARFAKAFRSNPAAMCITTVKEGRFIEVNERYCRLFDYPREALIGRTSVELALWAAPAVRAALVEQLQAHGLVRDHQARFRRRNGDAIEALISMELAAFPGEPEPVIVSMFADITERLQAEKQLREQAALLDLTDDAIIVRDLAHRVTYWNQGAERLYGWTAAEAVGLLAKELYALIPWEGRDKARQQLLEQGGWQGELHQRTKAGRELIVHSRWTLVRSADGAPQATLIINRDITEKKQLEAQFLRSQRMEAIGSLAGGIAHDLNNALAPVLMASEFLKMTNKDPDKGRVLDTIYESAQRGAGMVKQILTFARGSEGDRGLVQPKHLVKEMVDIARHTFPKAIQICTEVAADTWTLHGNPTQLHQILLNLCVNARDAMPNGGTLTLATSNARLDAFCAGLAPEARPGPYVALMVKDTGTGMPPEVRARIFDAFFTTKEPGKGTGLGLSTVHSIVKDHGGFVTVDSEVGKGTTFKVYLPAQETSGVTSAEAAPPTLPMGNRELILFVDDEAAIRSIARQTLQAFGYRVVTANDGAQAVAICAQHLGELQMVITDLAMPIMDGPAAIRAVRTLLPRLPVVAASGSDALTESPLLKELDVQAVLRKPFSADDLINTVHDVLHPK